MNNLFLTTDQFTACQNMFSFGQFLGTSAKILLCVAGVLGIGAGIAFGIHDARLNSYMQSNMSNSFNGGLC